MYLQIKPVHYDFLNCIEDNIVSVIQWMKADFEIMFSESWNFNIEIKDLSLSIGDIINSGVTIKDELTLLEKYRGIRTTINNNKSTKDLFESIKYELSINMPTLVLIDEFLLPWSNKFQSIHNQAHCCIVTGIDNDKRIILTDAWYRKENGAITLNNFYRGVNLNTYKFEKQSEVDNSLINWQEVLKFNVQRLLGGKNNVFEGIRFFANILESDLDIKKEIQGYEQIFQIPIIRKMLTICRNRKQFSIFLEYIYNLGNCCEMLKISECMAIASNMWNIVYAMTKKSMLSKYNKSLYLRIANKIREIADYEENLANNIIDLKMNETNVVECKSNNKTNQSKEISEANSCCEFCKQTPVNLSKYFNNKGFAQKDQNEFIADFSGAGEYFILDDYLSRDHNIMVGDMNFELPDFNYYDNISCLGQTIDVPKDNYNNIMILACTTWASFTEELTIHFLNEEIKNIKIEFTEWVSPPVFKEAIAWQGTGIRKNMNNNSCNVGVSIFAKSYLLDSGLAIDRIILPNCPNIHIFSITFSKQ